MTDAHKPDDIHDEPHDERLSALYRESAREEPPMALDSAILTRAREAAEVRKTRWRLSGWLMPVSAAAMVLLAATLFIQMRHEHPEAVAPASLEEAKPARPALKRTPVNEGMMKEELRQPEARDTMRRKSSAPAPATAPATAPARPSEPPAAGTVEPPATGMPEPKQQKAVGGSLMQERDVGAAALQAEKPVEGGAAAMTRSGKILYPESWIAKIRTLLKQGKKDEARREAEAFQAAYPDQPLPHDVVDALK